MCGGYWISVVYDAGVADYSVATAGVNGDVVIDAVDYEVVASAGVVY